MDKFKAKLNSYSYKEIQEMITLYPVEVLNPNILSTSYIDVKLHTNSTTIKNGFWLYYFVILQDNKDIVVSDPFSLMSYKQLHKRKNESFLERHKTYIINNKESLYPYYFKSMFYFDKQSESKSYKLKKTFNFGINFYQNKEITEINENSGNNLNMNKDEKIFINNENYSGSDEVMKDLMSFNPVLSDIQLDMKEDETIYNDNENYSGSDEAMKTKNDEINNNLNENIINLSRDSLQHENEYPSPSQSSTSSLLSSPIQIPSITLSPSNSSIDDLLNYKNLNNYSLDNNILNIQKEYLEFKKTLLVEEKKHLENTLNKIIVLQNYYIQCYHNNLTTTKDKFYENYLLNNINYIFQKRIEFSIYFDKLDKDIKKYRY